MLVLEGEVTVTADSVRGDDPGLHAEGAGAGR